MSGVGVDEHFDVAEIANPRVAEQQDAVDHHDLAPAERPRVRRFACG